MAQRPIRGTKDGSIKSTKKQLPMSTKSGYKSGRGVARPTPVKKPS